jgi:Short C-terminal domain
MEDTNMLRRRMVRRAVVGTAAVGGAAYLAGRHTATKDADQQQRDAAQEDQIAALQQQQYAPAPQYPPVPQYPPAPPPQYAEASSPAMPAPDPVERLKQLGELKAAGVLTDEEFQVKKAQLLKQV